MRGFIHRVIAHGDTFARSFSTVVACVPLRKLTLDGYFTLPSARAIVGSDVLTQVAELEISADSLTSPSILRQFARRGPWPELRQLTVIHYQRRTRDENAAWAAVWDEFRRAFSDRLRF